MIKTHRSERREEDYEESLEIQSIMRSLLVVKDEEYEKVLKIYFYLWALSILHLKFLNSLKR